MGKFKDEEATPKPETIQKQLEERKHHPLELPDVLAVPKPGRRATPTRCL